MTQVATIAVLAFAVGVAGCSRLGMDGGRAPAPLPASPTTPVAVSYTHLDVYKRQFMFGSDV